MSELLTLPQAIKAITDAFDEGDGWDRYQWVYIRGDVTDATCRLYLSHASEEDEPLIDHGGEAMPFVAAGHRMRHFLEAADFAEVLFVQRRRNPDSSTADFAHALDHYRRHDAYLGLPSSP